MVRLQYAWVALVRLVLVVFGLASFGVATKIDARPTPPVVSGHEDAAGGMSGGATKSDSDDDDDDGGEEEDEGDSD